MNQSWLSAPPPTPVPSAGNLPSLQTYPQMQVLGSLLSSVLELGSCTPPVPTSLGPPQKPNPQPEATCPLMGSL